MDKRSKVDRWIEDEVLPNMPGRPVIAGLWKTLFFCAAIGAGLGLFISLRASRGAWDWRQAIWFIVGGAVLASIGWALMNIADLWRANRYAAGKPRLKRAGPLMVILTALLVVGGIVAIVVAVSLLW